MDKKSYLACLIGLTLLATMGHVAQLDVLCQGNDVCRGDYAPGIVLVGLPPHPLTPSPQGGDGWGDGEILSTAKAEVHALRVPVGQECAALEVLRQDPNVAFAELDYAVHTIETRFLSETGFLIPNDPGWDNQWGPAKIDAPAAWDVITGTPDVIIAVIDTGVMLDHEDLAENLWTNPGEIPDNGIDDDGNGKPDDFWGWRFYHEWDGEDFVPGEDNNVVDDHGHGTHVAGIAGARIDNGVGIAGMAGGARLMTVKVLDASGDGWYSDLAQGIIYAVDNGARIINLSVGGEPSSETLQQAVDYAHAHGAVVVAASGNDGGEVLYPAACEHVLAVAATDQSDQRASFSNHGAQVDVAAPGESIYSTGYRGDYFSQSGTSMAAPHVAGLAGLMWSARPDLTAVQVSEVITTTALDVNQGAYPGWDEYLGWGRIDAMSALSTSMELPSNEYGVELAPLTATLSGTSGTVVTYTLAVSNTGSAGDTFGVTVSGNAWETKLSAASIGPLDVGVTDTLAVGVSIPLTATTGATDAANVTLTSVGDPAQSASSTLTTTALAAPATYDVEVMPPTAIRSGRPGAVVSHTLTVRNRGNVSDTFDVNLSGNAWGAGTSSEAISALGAGAAEMLTVYVNIPMTATDGLTDTVDVKVTSVSDPGASDSSTLVTTALWYKLHLLLIFCSSQ